jgi:hypothetical protein
MNCFKRTIEIKGSAKSRHKKISKIDIYGISNHDDAKPHGSIYEHTLFVTM